MRFPFSTHQVDAFDDRGAGRHRRARADRGVAGDLERRIAVVMREPCRRAMPRRSAIRRGNTEAWPWPVDCTLRSTTSVPSPGNVSHAPSSGVPPACSSMQEMPMPRYLAALLRFAPARFEAVVVGERQRLVEDRPEVAAVIGGADGGLVRHRGRRNEIAPPQLGRIDAGDARGLLDHALEHVVRFRPAGAAIRRGRDRVGEGAARADVDVLDVVQRRQAAGEIQGRDVGADRADIGAEIGRCCGCAAPESVPSRRARARLRCRCRAPGCR